MMLRATYRDGTGKRAIGRDVSFEEPSGNPFLRLLGRTKRRSKVEFEEVDFPTAIEAVERLHRETGFLQIDAGDGQSSVDFADSGDGSQFFIEQYYDMIYGGVYDLPTTRKIVEALFSGITSDDLRSLFSNLPGELIYDYEQNIQPSSAKLKAVSAEVRNALAPFNQNKG
jgi:hypothetical protein